ncbi:MAG: transposase [Lysobacterales bacterium]
MARPLRPEYPGALYHITSRGDRREDIFDDDNDRQRFLSLLAAVIDRYGWFCYAFCLMNNHYHLLIQTPEPNLSRGMRQLNGVYTQRYNRIHRKSGHVFQGRFKGLVVDSDAYLLELSRYIVLNPVRAGMIDHPANWPWSSYEPTVKKTLAPHWLAVDLLLANFGDFRHCAQKEYKTYVEAGIGRPGPWSKLQSEIYLGDEQFVASVQQMVDCLDDALEVPRVQRRLPRKPLEYYQANATDRNAGMKAAFSSGHYTLVEIAQFYGVHYSTVSRAVKR